MLLSKIGLDKILRRIMETGGLTNSMEADVQRLRDDYDEREGVLNKFGESYTGEDDEYDFVESSTNADFVAQDGIVQPSPLLGGAGQGMAVLDNEAPDGVPRDGDTILNDGSDYKSRYEELRKQYLDRFFGRDSSEAVEAQAADMYEDSEDEDMSIDDLLSGAPDGEKDEGK